MSMLLRIVSPALAFAFCMSCVSLSYPTPAGAPVPDPAPTATAQPTELDTEDPAYEPALSWNELTRSARDYTQRGDLAKAQERLDQAELQVRDRAPTNVQRRTVFGMRARLAAELEAAGEIETADELANELFAQAEAEPELGGDALVSLAVSVALRRQKAADEAEEPESQLHLLRIALETAQTGPSTRDRMELAFYIANEAYGEDDYALASRAIDQALIDAQRIIPTKKRQLGALEIYRARIALGQGDLDLAEVAATSANQIFAELEADPSNRGIAEAILAEILAKKGETDRALIIARGAHARIGNEESLDDHAQRHILASLARVERSAGDLESAQQHLEQALAIPAADFEPDRDLVKQLKIERQAFGDPDARPPSIRVLDAPPPPSQDSNATPPPTRDSGATPPTVQVFH